MFGIVFVLCMLIVPGQSIYVRSGNLWATSLSGNCESLLMLFRDGTVLVMTEYLDRRVSLPWDYVFKGRSPGDLLIVIHNHLGISRWSEADCRIYRTLREAGFKGYFLCRLGNGDILQMED